MSPLPLVSIIVPSYNYGHLLSETLNNISAQTFQNWECLVIDDGSKDNTRQVVEEFLEKDSRYKYIHQNNGGLSAARNTGIKNAKGAFIQLLDADDFIQENKLKAQIEVFEFNPSIDIVYSEARYFYTSSPNSLHLSYDGGDEPWMPLVDSTDHENLITTLLSINICVVNAPLIRKSVFEKIGDFNTSLKSVEDWEFWCRCAFSGVQFKFDSSPNTFALVRLHDTSMSRNQKGMLEASCIARSTVHGLILNDSQNILFKERLDKNAQIKAYFHRSLFDLYKLENDKRNAFRHLLEFGKLKNERSFILRESIKLILK